MKAARANRIYVSTRLAAARESLARLQALRADGDPGALSDPDRFAIAEHHMRRMLECTLDVARHLLAKDGSFKPATYPEMMDGLGRLGVIPPGLVRQVAELAEQRNRLVHEGPEVRPEELWSLIAGPIDCLKEYCGHIEEHLEAKGP